MRQLHVVSVSEDGRFVLLAPDPSAAAGTFRVALDARLAAAVKGELPRPGEGDGAQGSLTPRDIQARLRDGETVTEIARAAGLPVARVQRFAGPIESELRRLLDAAWDSPVVHSQRGQSAVMLGEAVDARLAEVAGLDPASVQWRVRRQRGGTWVVEVFYSADGRRRRAGWLYDPAAKTLSAKGAAALALGFVEPRRTAARARRTEGRPSSAATAAGTRQVTAVAGARPSRTRQAAPAAGVRSARSPAAAARPAPAATRPAPAASRATPAVKVPGRTVVATGAAVRRPPLAPTSTTTPPTPSARRAARDGQPPRRPAGPARTEPPQTPESPPQLRVVPNPDRRRTRRASVPEWADVLLSATPPPRPARNSD